MEVGGVGGHVRMENSVFVSKSHAYYIGYKTYREPQRSVNASALKMAENLVTVSPLTLETPSLPYVLHK